MGAELARTGLPLPLCHVRGNVLLLSYRAHGKAFSKRRLRCRPFLDLWILNHYIVYDAEKLNVLLEEGGLLTFAGTARQLAEIRIGNGEHNAVTKEVERYILSGGVYGTMDNRVAVQQIRRGGKLRYAMSRIWLPYDTLKSHSPSLEGKRFLLPFYEVRRWVKILFCGGAQRGVRELKLNSAKTKDEQLRMHEMLSHLGLIN